MNRKEVLTGIVIAILVVSIFGLIVWTCMPYKASGVLSSKTFTYTTYIDRLGSKQRTESYWTASAGVITDQWQSSRPVTAIDSEGKSTLEIEWYTVYEYRPWELQYSIPNTGSESPCHADTSGYPNGPEWRRRYREMLYWRIGEMNLAVKELADWKRFEVGDVINVKHRYGWLVSAELAVSEVASAEDFDL